MASQLGGKHKNIQTKKNCYKNTLLLLQEPQIWTVNPLKYCANA